MQLQSGSNEISPSGMKNVLAPLGPIKQSRREAHEVKRTATVSIVSVTLHVQATRTERLCNDCMSV